METQDDALDPIDATVTDNKIVDFAEHLNRCTADDVPTDIAIMGALTFVSALARLDPELTLRTAAALTQMASELSDLPLTPRPATH